MSAGEAPAGQYKFPLKREPGSPRLVGQVSELSQVA